MLIINFEASKLFTRIVFSFLLLLTPAYGAKRVALVIGNSAYEVGRLQNPSNDADDVASMLQTLGFEVTKLKDVRKADMEDAVDNVTKGLAPGDICFIFFAGHGMQLAEQNYLVPVGVNVDRPQHAKQRCVSVGYLLDALEFSDCSLKVVVVDACRVNPFRSFSRSKPGLAELKEAPEGTVVSFSTSPHTPAIDGEGPNSPYAKHLVSVFKAKAAKSHLVDLFLSTSRRVAQETGQRPILHLDAAMPEYYLRGSGPRVAMKIVTPPKPPRTFANTLGLKMRRIEAGSFMMGSHEPAESIAAAFGENATDFANEHPLRKVRIQSPFYISTTEVTYKQFQRFVEATGYQTTIESGRFGSAATAVTVDQNATWKAPSNGYTPSNNHPVTMVSYHDADAFCKWLSRQEGKRYRLPTDAEWEYAARAGTQTRFWNGNDARMLTNCLLYTSPSPRDLSTSRMPSSA